MKNEYLDLVEQAQSALARIAAATILMSTDNEEIRKIFLSGEDYETTLHSALGELNRLREKS